MNCVKILYMYAVPSHIYIHNYRGSSYKVVHVRGNDDSSKTLPCVVRGKPHPNLGHRLALKLVVH